MTARGVRSAVGESLPQWNPDSEWERVPQVSWWEYIGRGRIEGALARLEALDKPGNYHFDINTAVRPLPLRPESVALVRQILDRSTQNGQRMGKRYNNFALSSVFGRRDRNHMTVKALLKKCEVSDVQLRVKAKKFLDHFGIKGDPGDFSTWEGFDKDDFDAKFSTYREDPRLTALFKSSSQKQPLVVVRDIGIIALTKHVPIASLDEVKTSLNKLFIAMAIGRYDERGVVVPSLSRAVLMWGWLAFAIAGCVVGAVTQWSSIRLWSKDFFEMLVFTALSLPALVEYLSNEPAIIRNALRANRILWKNSQIKSYFNLDEFDYAVMALINTPMWLVSDHKASYLQKGGHPALEGDVCVTNTESLRRIGFYVGQSMARREWENDNVKIANNNDGSVSILKEPSSSPYMGYDNSGNRPVA